MRSFLHELWLRVKSSAKRERLDRDLDDELAHHLEMRSQKNREAGMDAEGARYAARRQFGNATQLKQTTRETWTFPSLESWWQDISHGLRTLRNNLSFTVVAVLILALGVGANTALFSVIKGVLLRSLPYRQPGQLVALARGDSQTQHPTNVSYGEAEDWKTRAQSLQEIALYRGWTPSSSGKSAPEIVYGLRVTRNFFEILGVASFLGRGFLPEEDRPDRWHIVVLSYPYWMRRYGGSPSVVGQTILLDQIPFQIVGVLPKDFESLSFTDAGSPPDLWAPLGYDMSLPAACRTCQHLHSVARLKDGVSLASARAELNSIASQLAREFPKEYPQDAKVVILPLRESWYGKIATPLWLLFGATAVVLLIACANVANLLLAQSAKKRREVALRSVLGATRLRIVRQLLTESTILSLIGGAGGLLLASAGTPLLLKGAPDDMPRFAGEHFDPGVFLFSLGLTTATGILMGLIPALQASRADYAEAMQQSSRTVRGVSPSRVRNLLVASQVCLAFVLTVAAGLVLKSFLRVWNVEPGFQAQSLFEVNFSFVGRKYNDDKVLVRAQGEVLDRVRHIPGVESACLVSTPPPGGSFGAFDQAGFIIQDRHIPDPEVPSVDRYIVSSGYFRTMEIPLLRGRPFTEADAAGSSPVAIVSEMATRQFFVGEDPLGRRIQLGGRHDDRPWATIVGVVGDVHQYGLDSPVTPQAYVLYSQYASSEILLVRSTIGAAALTQAIREQIWAIDKGTVVFNPAWMTEILAHSLAPRRFTISLLGGFGLLALVLAAVGIYGVMSYMVAQRTSEIGVRMALGAQPRDVLDLVSREGMLRAVLGLVAGLALSLIVTRLLTTQLFAVSALDPATFALVLLLLTVVAFSACYIPARRAARVDPMIALRHE